MGTSAFAAFMASLTNKKFTATQYALLTSIMDCRACWPRPHRIRRPAGWMGVVFILCTLAAVPGMMLLSRFAPWRPQLPRPPTAQHGLKRLRSH